jgi:adenosylmethionine-8-amino-7-oxononanoate aminotransferase
MALTVASDVIYQAFLSDDRSKMLFHGHSFTANPLGCAAALASLDLFEQAENRRKLIQLQEGLALLAHRLRALGTVANVRQTGGILAFDLPAKTGGYLDPAASRLRDAMLTAGILIRPLGEVVYLMPPYSLEPEEMAYISDTLVEELNQENRNG